MAELSLDKFLAQLEQGKATAPAIFLYGADAYLRDLCRSRMAEALVPEGARDWGMVRLSFDQDGTDRILQEAESMPMLAPRKVIFAADLGALEQLGDKNYDATLAALESYLANPAPFTVLVLEADKLDERMKLFKLLSSRCTMVRVSLAEGGDEEARRRVTVAAAAKMVPTLANEAGVAIEPDAAEELADALNGELMAIRTEIEKLAAYVGSRKRITLPDVDALVMPAKRYTVWQLADMLAGRRRDQALEFLDSLLREGEQPPALVGAMAWMVRKLLEAQEAPARLSGWPAAGYLKMRKDTAELALRSARRIPRQQLLAGLAALYEADSRLKSGPPSERAVLEFLVTRLTG